MPRPPGWPSTCQRFLTERRRADLAQRPSWAQTGLYRGRYPPPFVNAEGGARPPLLQQGVPTPRRGRPNPARELVLFEHLLSVTAPGSSPAYPCGRFGGACRRVRRRVRAIGREHQRTRRGTIVVPRSGPQRSLIERTGRTERPFVSDPARTFGHVAVWSRPLP